MDVKERGAGGGRLISAVSSVWRSARRRFYSMASVVVDGGYLREKEDRDRLMRSGESPGSRLRVGIICLEVAARLKNAIEPVITMRDTEYKSEVN
jgi:hypothetical protein